MDDAVAKCYMNFYKNYLEQEKLNAENIKKATERWLENIKVWSESVNNLTQGDGTIKWILASPVRKTFSSIHFRRVFTLSIEANKYTVTTTMQMKNEEDDDRWWREADQEIYDGLKTPLKTVINECSVM